METFTDAELRMILVEFLRDCDATFYAATKGGDKMIGYCTWCHYPTDAHARNCEGEERRTLAAKVTRILRGQESDPVDTTRVETPKATAPKVTSNLEEQVRAAIDRHRDNVTKGRYAGKAI